MSKLIGVLVIVLGMSFLLIGLAGLVRPERVADALGFVLSDIGAAGQLRAIVGGHYLAMGAVCIFAVARRRPELLLPIGIIEAFMLVGRAVAAVNGELLRSSILAGAFEMVAATFLIAVSLRAAKRA